MEDDSFTSRFDGEVYTVSSRTFALVAEEFFASYSRVGNARDRTDTASFAGALLQWMFWGALGLIRETNSDMPPMLPLTETQVIALSDGLYRAAIERGFVDKRSAGE